jgi:exosortase
LSFSPTDPTDPVDPTNRLFRLSIAALIAILAGLFLYRSAIIQVILAVIDRQGSSHGVFIPFLTFFFIWIRRNALKEIGYRYNCWGIILIVPGIFPILFRGDSFQIRFIGYIFVLSGISLTFLGWGIFRQIAFPLFFLITMTPLPMNLYDPLANYSRHIAFGGALKIISLFGIPYMKDGWVIHLPNAVLRVAIACSGIRYLISYFVFGLAYAWLFKRTIKGRLLIVALTIPVSHVASILRLTAIFTLAYTVSPRLAEHWPHIFISWTVFGIVLVGTIAADQYLDKRRDVGKLAGTSAGQTVHG